MVMLKCYKKCENNSKFLHENYSDNIKITLFFYHVIFVYKR